MEVSSGKLRRMQKKIVLIYETRSIYFTGHGVLISPDGLILTVAHLFGDSTRIGFKVHAKCHGGKDMFDACIIKLERSLDLALLRIEATKCEFARAKIAQEVRIGQNVHMIISGDDDIFSYAGGIVAFERRLRKDIVRDEHITYIDKETTFVQVNGLHGKPGCSGAPVFDSSGHIVGIYSNYYMRMDLLVHIAHLKTFSQSFIQVCHSCQ